MLLYVSGVLLIVLSWAAAVVKHLRRCKQIPSGTTNDFAGPVNLPLVGRIHDIPRNHNWIKFKEWGDQYGPIYRTKIFGENHIWIMKESIALDILGKRGKIYAVRRTNMRPLTHTHSSTG